MKKRYQQNMVIKAVVTTIFCAISFVVLYPLVYVVSAAFSPGVGIASVNIIPFADGFTIEHFVKLFTESDYGKWFRNTLVIALSTSVITVFVASLGAYVFSRFRFVIKKPMLMSYLILQIFPSFVGMVAIYVILLRIKGLGDGNYRRIVAVGAQALDGGEHLQYLDKSKPTPRA